MTTIKLKNFIKPLIAGDVKFDICLEHDFVKDNKDFKKYGNFTVEGVKLKDNALRIYIKSKDLHFDTEKEKFVKD